MARQIIPVSDVASILLTQDEGDLRYLPLSYVPPATDLSNYWTKAQADARYEPLDSAYTKAEADAKYALTSHNHDAAYSPVAHLHDTSYLKLSGGALTGNLGVGTTLLSWDAAFRAVQIGQQGAAWADNSGTYMRLSSNLYHDGTQRVLVTGPSSLLQLGAGGMDVYTAPSAAAGTTPTLSQRLTFSQSGTLGLGPGAGAGGTLGTAISTSGGVMMGQDQTGLWHPSYRVIGFPNQAIYCNAASANTLEMGCNSYVGTDGVRHALVGTIEANLLQFLSSQLNFYQFSQVAQNATQTAKLRFQIDANGRASHWTDTISSGPPGFVVYSDNNVSGWQAKFYRSGIEASAYIGNAYSNRTMIGTSGTIIVFNTGCTDTSLGTHRLFIDAFALYPAVDNSMPCGQGSNRFTTVYAVAGAINTSHAEAKKNFKPLDPTACTNAVLETDWLSYEYLPPPPPERIEGETNTERLAVLDEYLTESAKTYPVRKQNGYVLGHPTHKTHDLFGLADRQSASPSADLGILACALQSALQRIAVLEGKPV